MAQNEQNGVLKGLVIGLLAGGVLGALFALLYAPKSGKELRADIRERADGLLEGADDMVQAAKSQAGKIVSDAKLRSSQLITEAKKEADTLLHDADRILSGARQKTATLAEEGSRMKDAVKAGVDAYKEERRKG